MTNPIPNFERVYVRGRFVDMVKAAAGEESIGVSGSLRLTPTVSPGALVNAELRQIIATGAFTFSVNAQTGVVAGLVYATNDPDLVPAGWTYQVIEPATGRSYPISVPHDTPVLDSPGDPLHGERVLELSSVVPAASPNPGTVQLMRGRGVESIDVVSDELVVSYDDGTSQNLGPLPAGAGGGGLSEAQVNVLIGDALADLATVAETGAYADLTGTPSIPSTPGDIGAQPAGSYAAASHSHPEITLGSLGGVGSPDVDTIRVLSQAAYDELTPDPDTLYVIVD